MLDGPKIALGVNAAPAAALGGALAPLASDEATQHCYADDRRQRLERFRATSERLRTPIGDKVDLGGDANGALDAE